MLEVNQRPHASSGVTPRSPGTWLSAHLFLNSPHPRAIYRAEADTVIRDCVVRLLASHQSDLPLRGRFYIRYAELGPHIRLRLLVDPADAAEVATAIVREVQRRAANADIELWSDQPGTMRPLLSWAEERRAGDRTHRDSAASLRALRWIPYKPETARYGGQDAVLLAERIFEASTDLALALLVGLDSDDRTARLGRALLAYVATLHVFCTGVGEATDVAQHTARGSLISARARSPLEASAMERLFADSFERQAESLRGQVREIWSGLDGQGVTPAVDAYVAAIAPLRAALAELCSAGQIAIRARRVADWPECVRLLVPHYLHMTNNRLGITLQEEAYLAHLVYRALC